MKLDEIKNLNEGIIDKVRKFARHPGREFNKALTWDYVNPREMKERIQSYSDEELLSLLGDGIPSIKGSGSERQHQMQLIKRELRRRGLRDFERYMD